jgi:NAD dependent epimerase/dehydratase family enzyme
MLTPFRWASEAGGPGEPVDVMGPDDLVELIVRPRAAEFRGPVNGASPNPVTNAEFTTAWLRCGRPFLTVPAPPCACFTVNGGNDPASA